MPFIQAKTQESFSDFVGHTVLIVPVEKVRNVQTVHGVKNPWSCTVHVIDGDSLTPHEGIYVFADGVCESLDEAHRSGSPVLGTLTRKGEYVRLVWPDAATVARAEALWDARDAA